MSASSTDHLIALPGGSWSVWRCACLRGAGFPASLVLRFAAGDAATAADRLLDAEDAAAGARSSAIAAVRRVQMESPGDAALTLLQKADKLARKGRVPPSTGTAADAEIEGFRVTSERAVAAREEFDRAFEKGLTEMYRAAQELAADPRIREAVTWQNRGALETGFASLLRCDPATMRSKDRQHVALVGSYLQRYCTKNDTIGFFGPVGWARFSSEGGPMVAQPAEELLAARGVYFEQWGIDAIADKLSKDARMAPWMAPRRMPFLRVDGTSVHSAVNGKHTLTEEQALVLAACGGGRTAREVAAGLVTAHSRELPTEIDVFAALSVLREKKLVAWSFEVPLIWNPDHALRTLLATVGHEALRAEALQPLDELDRARDTVACAAGNAALLGTAFDELESTFTRLTGVAPTRQAGTMYAARMLIFEDCRRGLDLTVGPEVLASLGPALTLVLESARWFTFEVAKIYRDALRAIYVDLARRQGTVRFADVWFRAQRLIFGSKERPLDPVVTALQERWSRILTIPTDARQVQLDSTELRPGVLEAFAAPRPGWSAARHHSPDVMIAAESVEAIRRGEYSLVLGEIHVSSNTLDSSLFHAQHPNPSELQEAFRRDLPDSLVVPTSSKDWLGITTRTNREYDTPNTLPLEASFDIARGSRDRILALGDLTVEELDGELVVRAAERPPIELIEVFGESVSQIVVRGFRMLEKKSHSPRVTIDRLVVARESWSFPSSEMLFAYEADEAARFLGARRWARAHGLPRFVFAKSSIEVKPVYVDFDSPHFVSMLAKTARAAKEHVAGETAVTISEMLPGLDKTWLPDAQDERYTSEIRVVAVDAAR
jgi:hypothetical protein